jgi:hypothetical protein
MNLNPIPQRLKPLVWGRLNGGAEAPPLQSPVWSEPAQRALLPNEPCELMVWSETSPQCRAGRTLALKDSGPGVEGDGLQPVR